MNFAVLRRAALAALLAVLPVAAGDTAVAAVDPFPEFESTRGNVGFWIRVFGEWRLGQAAVHDLGYPAIVYEVVELPGPVEDRYTDEQIEFVEDLVESWQDRLKTLKHKVENKQSLTDDEKRWALLLTTHAGSNALAEADERVRTQRGQRERFRRGLEVSYRYDSLFREIFRKAGLPEDLAYLPHVESSFRVDARSSAGAVGAWQFTRGTGRRYMKVTSAFDERRDPVASARGAAAYLTDAYAHLPDWPLALTSYNHGVRGIQRATDKLGMDYERVYNEYDGKRFGFASKNFYSEFLAVRTIARAPETYFPEGLSPEPVFDHDSVILAGRTTPGRLSKAYGVPVDELAAINRAWTSRTLRSGLALPSGIVAWLPAGTLDRIAVEGREPNYILAGWIDHDGSYVVRPGDTLSVIAETYGTSVADLRELNGMPAGSSLIRTGQRLRLGEGAGETVHVVARGETLSEIARDYGMPLSRMREMNGIPANENLIRVGQTLRVSRGAATVHVVRRGDTLGRIASVNGVNLTDLLRYNRLSTSSIIHPGQQIRIPSAH